MSTTNSEEKAPNDEAMAKSILTAERWGAARLETLQAFSEAEGKKTFGGL